MDNAYTDILLGMDDHQFVINADFAAGNFVFAIYNYQSNEYEQNPMTFLSKVAIPCPRATMTTMRRRMEPDSYSAIYGYEFKLTLGPYQLVCCISKAKHDAQLLLLNGSNLVENITIVL